MIFLLDENFPKTAQQYLASRGHEVHDVRGTESEGSSDDSLFSMAIEHRSVFLTTDKDFYHTVPHRYTSHSGVVVIALRQPNRENIMTRLGWFLSHFADKSLDDKVFLLRDRSYVLFSRGGKN